MQRRTLLTSVGAVLFAGCSAFPNNEDEYTSKPKDAGSTQNRSPVDIDELPSDVKSTNDLAQAFYERVTQHYDGARAFITQEGDIALEYQSTSESTSELETEFHQLADLYADVVSEGDHDPVTLSIIVGEVQAIAPKPSVAAYARGDLEKDAFLETIQLMGVNRNE